MGKALPATRLLLELLPCLLLLALLPRLLLADGALRASTRPNIGA